MAESFDILLTPISIIGNEEEAGSEFSLVNDSITDNRIVTHVISVEGLHNFGNLRNYTETFPENEMADVVLSDKREPTDVTINLVFIPSANTRKLSTEEQYNEIATVYNYLIERLEGKKILYRDTTVRKRMALLYLESQTEVKEEKLYGQVYIKASLKFKNYYGRCFETQFYQLVKNNGVYSIERT